MHACDSVPTGTNECKVHAMRVNGRRSNAQQRCARVYYLYSVNKFPFPREIIVLSTHVDQARVVSLSQVVQHRGFVEAGEVGHVLHFAEARGVHALHLLPGQSQLPLAVGQLHLHLIAALLPNTGRLGMEAERYLTKEAIRRIIHKCEFPEGVIVNLITFVIDSDPRIDSDVLHFLLSV